MRRIATLVLGLAAALAAAAAAAHATTVSGVVNPGSPLSVSAPAGASFALTLDGTDQTPTYTLPLTVTDPRGSGAGWNLTITSTQFDAGSSHVLATNASTVTGVTAACVSGSTCASPTNSVTAPSVPSGTTAPAAVKLYNAAANSGMGKITVTPTVAVSVPANVYAGTYTSTVTIAIVSGP
jgi:opacity protein-like surface antigen